MKDNQSNSNFPKRNIAYIGQFKFPNAEAASYRALGVIQSLQNAGYNIHVCTGQLSQFCDTKEQIVPVDYINFSVDTIPSYKKLIKFLLSGYKTVKWLSNLESPPDIVFMFGGYSVYAIPVLLWCRYRKIPLIVDIVDWLEASHLSGLFLSIHHLNIEMAMRYFYVKCKNVITISHYLESYYESKGCKTFRIPPTLDVNSIDARIEVTSKVTLNLAYTGSPGKKDLLNNVIEAVIKLNVTGKKIMLTVAGVTENEMMKFDAIKLRNLVQLPSYLTACGRITRDEALQIVRQADFTVLLRPQLRYANAGFPTKIPESLSVGTPVICNLTSDLGDYIVDGINGLICQNHTPEALTDTLVRALNLTTDQLQEMRHAARREAENSFDYRNYTDSLSSFLDEICQ